MNDRVNTLPTDFGFVGGGNPLPAPDFGPTGEAVFNRTYSRPLPDGTRETWADTVARVIRGNLGLVYGKPETWSPGVQSEARTLFLAMYAFDIVPAGRHLWASGVPGSQFLSNCHVAGWGPTFASHFEFLFLRLMEAGGVGANYATESVQQFGAPRRTLNVHVVIDPDHADAAEVGPLASGTYSHEWPGAFVVEDSREGWAAAMVDLMETFFTDDHVAHANRVFDLSRIRPRGSKLRTFGGTASGPAPLARLLHTVAEVLNTAHGRGYVTPLDAMAIDHAIGEGVVSGGVRRSARMSILPWDDPFLDEFLACKADTSQHWTTNISVAVDDAFFDALDSPEDDPGAYFRAQRTLLDIAHGMVLNGEPGVWNRDRSGVGEVGEVEATNPCGEIALEPWENCNLGHVNLERFAGRPVEDLLRAHTLMARFLVRATFGDVTSDVQRAVMDRNRRIGVGHFGVQGYLVRTGVRYSEAPKNADFVALLDALRRRVRAAARDYAFELRIPEPVKVTAIAPTGTVAKMPGASEGIHPVYARFFIRRVRFSTVRAEEMAIVEDYRAKGYHVEPCLYAPNTLVVAIPTRERLLDVAADPALVEDAGDLPLEAMFAFQAMYQRHYADNAVSMTVNFEEGTLTAHEVADALGRWLPALKGTTLMPDGSRPQAPYERLASEDALNMAAPVTVADSYDDDCASGACPVR